LQLLSLIHIVNSTILLLLFQTDQSGKYSYSKRVLMVTRKIKDKISVCAVPRGWRMAAARL